MLLSFLWSLSSASSRRELALYQCSPAAFDRSSWDASRSGGMSQQQCPHLLFQFPQYQEKVQESPTQIGKTWWLVTSFSIAMFNLVILVFRLFGLGYLWLRSNIWSRPRLFCLRWNHWHMFPDFILGFHACKTGTVHHPTPNMKHQMTQAKHTARSSADIHLCNRTSCNMPLINLTMREQHSKMTLGTENWSFFGLFFDLFWTLWSSYDNDAASTPPILNLHDKPS